MQVILYLYYANAYYYDWSENLFTSQIQRPPFGGHVMVYIRMRILSTLKILLFTEYLEAKYTVMYLSCHS
jgi:hypothetical protein